MKYLCIKLITGEELIGTTEFEEGDEFVNLEDPVKISNGYDSEGNFGLRFTHFMSYCEERLFTFKHRDIILYSKPTDGLIKYYNEYFAKSQILEEYDVEELFNAIPMPSYSKH